MQESTDKKADKRKFIATIALKHGDKRVRFEIAEGAQFGGNSHQYRLRKNRQWVKWYDFDLFTLPRIAQAIVEEISDKTKHEPHNPVYNRGDKVLVKIPHETYEEEALGSVTTTPILDYGGNWKVFVVGYGFAQFFDCREIIKKVR